jgi:hypothetical protein
MILSKSWICNVQKKQSAKGVGIETGSFFRSGKSKPKASDSSFLRPNEVTLF